MGYQDEYAICRKIPSSSLLLVQCSLLWETGHSPQFRKIRPRHTPERFPFPGASSGVAPAHMQEDRRFFTSFGILGTFGVTLTVRSESRCLGTHVSIRGGLPAALERGESLGCGAIQIFSHSSRTWAAPLISPEEIGHFQDRHRRSSVGPVLVHASYLINTATSDPKKREKSAESLRNDWILANRLGVYGLVLHPGSSAGQTEEDALERSAEMIREAISSPVEGETLLLLENTAGGGKTMGRNPRDMERLLDRVDRSGKVALCLDSCHLLASGAEIRTPKAYEEVMSAWQSASGRGGVRAWHLNDALFEKGSGRDRHAHIGTGYIGLWFFWNLLHDPRFAGLPMVLETPKGDETDLEDRANLSLLERLAAQDEFRPTDPGVLSLLGELEALA